MKLTLRPYQNLIASAVLEQSRCNVFSSMGTGKTAATLAAIDALHFTGELTQPALVIAPLRVARSTWPDEQAKWDRFAT